jgi:tRNA(fMet)-specific endonuclease VapC
MSYLLDTDWVISFLNGRADAIALVAQLAPDGSALIIVTCGEVYEGLLSVATPLQQPAAFDAFVAMVELIAPDDDIARQYAGIRHALRAQGQLLADNDLWIAATVLSRNLTLASRDQHFARIPGLKRHAFT